MSKLQRLKSWYSIEETAAMLSQSLGEVVNDRDVIQLAAEGALKCCWFLNGDHFARRATAFCAYPRDQRYPIYSKPVYDVNGESWGESLSGICRLPIEWCPAWGWWILTFIGLGSESGNMCGALVIDEDGVTWELYDEPSNGTGDFFHFPKRHEVVFRREDIDEFKWRTTQIAGHISEKPHHLPRAESEDQLTEKNDIPAPQWVTKSIEIANSIGAQRWAAGQQQITARNICGAVATELEKGEMNEPQRYHGTQGPRSASSVRNALKGWKFTIPAGTNSTNGTNR